MTVEAQRCVGPQEKPRIGSGVGEASFQEWCHLRERMLETVRPVKSRATGTQAALAVTDRSGTCQHGSVAQSRIQKLPAEVNPWIANSAVRSSSRGRTGHIHKING